MSGFLARCRTERAFLGGVALLAASTVVAFGCKFAHPDLTRWQLLVEFWPLWAGVAATGGVGGLLIGRA